MTRPRFNILLIQNNPEDILMVRESLALQGDAVYSAVVTNSIKDGLEVIQSNPCDAVLMDLVLPDASGIQAFQRIHERYPGLPVVVLTSLADEQSAMLALQAGAQDFLVKGFTGMDSIGRSLRYAIERQQTQAALIASQQHFATAFHANPIAQIITRLSDGFILDTNQAFLNLFGYTRAEISGRTSLELELYTNPQERQMVVDQLRQHGSVQQIELVGRKKSGEFCHTLMSAEIIKVNGNSQVLSTIVDITRRKQDEQALATSRVMLDGVVASATDAIIAVDATQSIVLFNPAAEQMFGYRSGDMLGQPLEIIIPERFRKQHTQYVTDFGNHSQVEIMRRSQGIVSGLHRDGTEFPLDASISWIETAGQKLFTVILRDIKERKKAEEALAYSEQKYRSLFENATVGMFRVSRDTMVILEANTKLVNLLGKPPVEITGQPVSALFSNPDEWQRMLDLLEVQGVVTDYESILKTVMGIKTCLFSLSTIANEQIIEGTIHDITNRKQAEASLRKRTSELTLLSDAGRELAATLRLKDIYPILYRYLAMSVPCDEMMISSYDPVLKLITCEFLIHKEGAMDVSGFPPIPLEPEGKGTQSIVIRSGAPLLLPDYQAFQHTANNSYYFDHDGNIFDSVADDEEHYRSAVIVPLLLDNRVAGVLQIFSYKLNAHNLDHMRFVEALAFRVSAGISNAALFDRLQTELDERRRAEEEVRQLNIVLEQRVAERTSDLSRANSQLAQASRAKDDFLASMSHELRTPLSAILTLTESLQEGIYGELGKRQERPLKIISESGQHLLNLINDILDLSKIEAGKLEAQIVPQEVDPLCQSSLRLVRQQAHKKNQQLSLDIDPRVKLIHADARMLKQMLVNLLGNAVKFTPSDGKIGLQVTGIPDEDIVQFTIWDNGIGIDTQKAKHLFKPFVQADAGLDRQYGGTGLGLSLVYRMAELHGGGVSLVSSPGQGSRFTVSLPWGPNDQAAIILPVPAKPSDTPQDVRQGRGDGVLPASNSTHKNPTILVAEDNPSNQITYFDYLNEHGYQVLLAANGLEAISKAHETRPDVILMDVQMPGMDGLEATRHIRQDPDLKDTPIIMITALAMPGDRQRCLDSGADLYITKPVSLTKLAEIIASYVHGGRLEPLAPDR